MDVPFFKLGAKISIISKANVRYEGVFVEIDQDNLQIALSDVRFYGTETRNAEVFIAGQDRIYPYVIFKSSDINDIRVLDEVDEQQLEPAVQINQYVRRDYPQSTLEFLRTYPFGQFGSSTNVLQTPIHASAFQRDVSVPRSYWSRYGMSPSSFRGYQRYRRASYMWRIPRVNDFLSRSGDPNELPIQSTGDDILFDQEFDFEKNNKIFENLLQGMNNLSLTEAYDGDDDCSKGEESSDSEEVKKETTTGEEKQQPPIETISTQDVTPKKVKDIETKTILTPTAYNKAKSFFDTVSCASIYRSPNINPNWREWNKETFGISMINHQRRKRRPTLNAIKGIEKSENETKQISEKLITDENPKSISPTEENVSVQKIRFQAVVVTKTRSGNKHSIDGTKKGKYDKNSKNEIKSIERSDAEKYSLKAYK